MNDELRQKAKDGDAEAQYWLGVTYEYGVDVNQDYEAAIKWYEKAADQGHVIAQNTMGDTYYAADDEKALFWYTKAAEQGYADAQAHLGWMYERGRGIAQDNKKAAIWYAKAADQGHEVAQYNLGLMSRR